MNQSRRHAPTWNLAGVEGHGDIVNGSVFGQKRRMEQWLAELRHVTWHVTVVDDNLNATTTGLGRVDWSEDKTTQK